MLISVHFCRRIQPSLFLAGSRLFNWRFPTLCAVLCWLSKLITRSSTNDVDLLFYGVPSSIHQVDVSSRLFWKDRNEMRGKRMNDDKKIKINKWDISFLSLKSIDCSVWWRRVTRSHDRKYRMTTTLSICISMRRNKKKERKKKKIRRNHVVHDTV